MPMRDSQLQTLKFSLHLSEGEYADVQQQAQEIAKSRIPFYRLITDMKAAATERLSPRDASKKAPSQRVADEARADLKILNECELEARNPLASGCSEWLRKKFDTDWTMTPSGKTVAQLLQATQREIIEDALTRLASKRQDTSHTSVTSALRDAGFLLVPRQVKNSTATFVADGLSITLTQGMLDADGNTSQVPNHLIIEKLHSEKEEMRIAGLRHTFRTLTKATDELGIQLHIKPTPINLGDKLKPLDGEPLLALLRQMGFDQDGNVMHRIPRNELDLYTLLELGQTPTSDQEMEEQARVFRQALQAADEPDGWKMHHLFDEPREIVRTEAVVREYVEKHGYLSAEQAQARVGLWKDAAYLQGMSGVNSDKVVLSLFDNTGEWSKPWREAGYDVYQFDIQSGDGVDLLGINTGDVTNFSTEFFNDIFGSFDGKDIYCILAANPCTDFANSGARHFEGKDANGTTSFSVGLVQMTLAAVEYFKPSIWALENPTGRIERLSGLPQWSMSFDPCNFGEDYTKRTLLWGRMNGNLPVAPCEPTEGSKMHRLYGGKSLATKNARSVTPEGFAYAFFMANNAYDNPALAMRTKFDRLDPAIIEHAVNSGLSEQRITELVEDYYYFDLDDEAANNALAQAVGYEAPQQSLFVASADGAMFDVHTERRLMKRAQETSENSPDYTP